MNPSNKAGFEGLSLRGKRSNKNLELSLKGTTNFKGMRNYLVAQYPDKKEALNELFDWYIVQVGY